MIDWNESAKLNNTTVDELKKYFDRFPQSHKKIIAICEGENCSNRKRELTFGSYCDLCRKCAGNLNDSIILKRELANKYWSDQTARDAASMRTTKYHKDHPEVGVHHSETMNKYWSNPNHRKAASEKTSKYFEDLEHRRMDSEIMKNSEAHKMAIDKQRGGNDIVKHHYLYDFNDLTKYTIEVTRSEHQKIHRALQTAGLEVPCINIMISD